MMILRTHLSFSRPWFVSSLLFLLAGKLFSEKAFRVKFQDWVEDDDRIRVRSWYAETGTSLKNGWEVGVVGMVDTITGSTPYGAPPTDNRSDWLAELEEERRAGVISLATVKDDYEFSFEFGLSDEPDYLSRSYALSLSRNFAEDTLTLHTGLSYLNDEVDSNVPGGPGLGIQSRRTPEIFLGIHRILDPQTTLAFNLTYGRPEGYLSDPYKQIGRTEPVFPGSSDEDFYLYAENRPNERETFVAYLEGVRLFMELDASAEASYRFFSDDADLSGHTFEFQWFQRLGDKFVLRPLLRHYQQNAADFYLLNLDNTGITPVPQPDGTGSFYSSDYRLSAFKANTYGLKLTYFHRSDLSFDLSYDRYAVTGTDGQTDQRVYPDAGVLTFGFQWGF